MECIFCKIVNGKIPAKIISQTPNCISFLDAFPLAEGHCLVIPKNHYEKLQDIPVEENAELFGLVRKITYKVDKLTGSTLIAIHNGKESGQEIPHLHIHIVPRKKGDGAGPIHSMFPSTIRIGNDQLEKIYKKLRD